MEENRQLALVKDTKGFNTATATLSELKEIATLMAASEFFKDADEAPKAFAKILVGLDLNIPITAALRDVNIIQGRPALSANLIAALIKKSGKYKYIITEHTLDKCKIEFSEREDKASSWEYQGFVEFTMEDAKTAGLLTNLTWKKYPKDMLFARAISSGARKYCGDVLMGSVYTPDELDPNVSLDQDGNIIDKEPVKKAKIVVKAVTTDGKPEDTSMSIEQLVKDIEQLAILSDYDLKGFLKESKVSKLSSLDRPSLLNIKNTLNLRLENVSK